MKHILISKKGLFVFFFMMSLQHLTAQVWQPLQLNCSYNYIFNGATSVTHILFIDTIYQQGQDSVMQLNRIGTLHPADSSKLVRNMPQFLLRTVTKTPDGDFWFTGPGKFCIKSRAALNQSWMFDSVAGKTATVVDVNIDSVFNVQDSIKKIVITPGTDTIILSKNYGFIRFPKLYNSGLYWELIGVNGKGVGWQDPDVIDFFDYNVGDILCYHSNFFWMDWMQEYEEVYQKDLILSRSVSGDQITCQIESQTKSFRTSYSGSPGGTSWMYNGTSTYYQTFADSTKPLCKAWPNMVINTNQVHNYGPYDRYSPVRVFTDSNGIHKSLGFTIYNYANYTYEDVGNADTLDLCWDVPYYTQYTAGIGLMYFNYYFFEHDGYTELVGYVKDGDTTGTIFSDPWMVNSVDDRTPNNLTIRVYPNPAQSYISLEMPFLLLPNDGVLEIINLSGIKVLSISLTKGEPISNLDISTLSQGLYIGEIRLNDGPWGGFRFVKNRH